MKKATTILLLAALCAAATLTGGEPDGPVVVLKNGTVLRGKGTSLGEKVAIELTDGGEVKLLKTQVEIIAESMEDAYLQRRAKLLPENVLSQLNLAHWCLDQELKPEALLHLRAAKRIDATHPGIIRLERKLKDQQRAAEEELPKEKIETPEPSAVKDLLKSRVEAARRESLGATGDISAQSRTRFIKDVQPILLGSCAASKCHGPSSDSEFRIIRSSTHSENHALLLKRNLQTVLGRLNAEVPEESPLLEKAAQLHADNMKAPPIAVTSKEFNILIDWVIAATDDLKGTKPAPGMPPPSIGAAGNSTGNTAKAPASLPGAAEPRQLKTGPIRDEAPESRPKNGEPRVAEKSSKSPPKRGATAKSASKKEPETPGDPSEFNERYFPSEPK